MQRLVGKLIQQFRRKPWCLELGRWRGIEECLDSVTFFSIWINGWVCSNMWGKKIKEEC